MAIYTAVAQIDSKMNGLLPNNNWGTTNPMNHGVTYSGSSKTEVWRAIANFNVSALAGATINSAKLRRNVSDDPNSPFDVRFARCTRPADWTEGGVTWNKYDGVNNWTAAGGDVDLTTPAAIVFTEPLGTGWVETTGFKPFVDDALQFRSGIVSIISRAVDENPGVNVHSVWASREAASNKWELEVDYTPSGVTRVQTMRNYW